MCISLFTPEKKYTNTRIYNIFRISFKCNYNRCFCCRKVFLSLSLVSSCRRPHVNRMQMISLCRVHAVCTYIYMYNCVCIRLYVTAVRHERFCRPLLFKWTVAQSCNNILIWFLSQRNAKNPIQPTINVYYTAATIIYTYL